MTPDTGPEPVEFVVCGAGAALAERVMRCLPAARVVTHAGELGAWLGSHDAEAGLQVLVIDMQGLPAMQWPQAADAASDRPTIWIAPPVSAATHDELPPQALHVLPHDFTTTEFAQAADTLLQEIGARAMPLSPAGEDTVISFSPLMEAVLAEVDLFANCEHNVLIEGATGTGKERMAQRLHRGHARYGQGPFVPVNCGAIPDGLFESHFFGHARGAFTGALHAHKGYFEQADGGTLFLDEVGDLPLLQQVKLLRVLESGNVTRLGTETSVRVQFRLVAATNRKLRELVERGEFRSDLYYRLAVIELQLPTLEDRGVADKIAIFKAVVQRVLGGPVNGTLGEPPFWLVDAVAGMRFPGNVRQLRNLAERVGVIARQTGQWDRPLIERALASLRGLEGAGHAPAATRRNWDPQERDQLIETLDAHGWKRQDAARTLGISRKVLWEKMRKYQIVEGDSHLA